MFNNSSSKRTHRQELQGDIAWKESNLSNWRHLQHFHWIFRYPKVSRIKQIKETNKTARNTHTHTKRVLPKKYYTFALGGFPKSPESDKSFKIIGNLEKGAPTASRMLKKHDLTSQTLQSLPQNCSFFALLFLALLDNVARMKTCK